MNLYIDAENINARSAYHVEQLSATSFYFTTNEGLHYLVGFSEDYSFAESGVYQFYLIEKDHKRGKHDPSILQTATVIIEEFFRYAPGVMLYVCDSSDNLHAVRNRLFQYWFTSYPDNNKYVLVTEDVLLNGEKYYAGLLLAKSHPQLGEIIQSFHTFIQSLPDKLA